MGKIGRDSSIGGHGVYRAGFSGQARLRSAAYLYRASFVLINKRKIIFAVLTLLCTALVAKADTLKTLYQANVPVTSHASKEHNAAVQDAFKTVLIKVSGNDAIATLPAIRNQFSRAASFVQQYSYHQQAAAAEGEKPKLFLQVNFDRVAVNRLLRKAGQALWGENRPLIAVWLAMKDPNGPVLIGSDSNSQLPLDFKHEAQQRGLPIVFPLLDLSDMSSVSLDDVWNFSSQNLLDASKRYNSEAVLAGRLVQTPIGSWQGNWVLLYGYEHMGWQTSGKTPEDNIHSIVDDVADALSARYAVLESSGGDGPVYLTVSGIHNFKDYAKVLGHLEKLSPVSRVDIKEVSPEQIEFALQLAGGQQSLVQVLAMKSLLTPEARISSCINYDSSLQYRLIK